MEAHRNRQKQTFNQSVLRSPALILAFVALAFAGCKSEPPSETIYKDGQMYITRVPEDDIEMNTAMQKAKDTVDEFITALDAYLAEAKKTMAKGDEVKYVLFSVKHPFPTDSGGIEHIWVQDPTYANGKFTGTLAVEPVDIKGLKTGQIVDVPKDEISDWIIQDGKTTRGGFTVKVLLDREKKKQKG